MRIFLFILLFYSFCIHAGQGNVLVTGGAGYIGSHTCKALAQAGFTPIVYDLLAHGHPETVKWGPLIQADINDKDTLRKVFETYHPVAVIHFAAWLQVGESVAHPAKYYRNNLAGTLSLLEVMLEFGVDRFIFSSTASTYGNPEYLPIDENHPQHPINPYGTSKLMSEIILKDFDLSYGIRHVIFRYFNAAGADSEGEVGILYEKPSHLLPIALEVAAKKRAYLEIFGTDYPTPDGTGIRDYIHVTDLASAHVLGLEYLLQGNPSVILNLGTGKGYSVKEVIAAVEKITGQHIAYRNAPRRPGDPSAIVCDASKCERLLGWKAQYSDLTTLIQTAWNWHLSRVE